MTSSPSEQLHLRVAPHATRTFDSPFGRAGYTIGTGDRGVIVELTPPAAEQLARIIGGSVTIHDADVDEQAWISVMLDLLSCSAFCEGQVATVTPAPGSAR